MSGASQTEESVQIRARPPSPKRLSRKVLLSGALALGGIVAFALLSGLSERPDRRAARAEDAPAAAPAPPENLRQLPARYTSSALAASQRASDDDSEPRDMLWGERGPPEGWVNPPSGDLEAPNEEFWAGDEEDAPASRAARAQPAANTAEAPAHAPIFFDVRGGGRASAANGGRASMEQSVEGGGSRFRENDSREGFMARQRRSDDLLDAPYVAPRSAFEIQAGAIIPAALLTGLNSDLPGRVIAQVTAPVFDSATGDHLLIPQGARLIGAYDSATSYGDRRLLLVWNRLVMPNGWSIALGAMEATDPEGAAGLRDKTDNHLDRLAGAVALSAVLSIVANEAEDKGDDRSFRQSIGDAAAQEAARVGGRIVDRELNVRPTLRVRPGAPVRVLVTHNIVLRPYSP